MEIVLLSLEVINYLLNYKVLPPAGITILDQIVNNGSLISVNELANKSKIKAINAGKIMSGLNKNIDKNLIRETREGPANHPNNWLLLNTEDENSISLSILSVKQIYQIIIKTKFIPPVVEKVWSNKLNISPKGIDWKEICKKATCKMMDHEDKDLWFRVRHRILPYNDNLCKMGMETNTKCGICKQEKETVEHLFIYFVENILRKYTGNIYTGIYFSMIVTTFWVMGKT